MTVPSLAFLGFAAVAALAYNLGRSGLWRQLVLLATNLVFLSTFVVDPLAAARNPGLLLDSAAQFAPYFLFLAAGFLLVRWIQAGASRAVYVAAIVVTLFAFFWLKKYTFLPSETFLAFPYLLVGLSYVFFRVLHLVIDARDPAAVPRVGLVNYLNYTLNFTSLVSGPIQRYDDYCRQTGKAPASLDLIDVGVAVQRIVVGLFKVMVVSLLLADAQKQLITAVLSDEALALRILHAGLLAALFPVYLFFNFSGYMDFVIGTARFFRIRLPENFNRPFSATSFIEYWSRWHMTLSDWLKTYVYNPLLMVLMRRVRHPAISPFLGVFALFVTFFLIGAWHGRTSVFLFFGVLNGLGVAVNQYYRIMITRRLGRKAYAALSRNRYYIAFSRGLTFTWLSFTLLWFWSDWGQLGDFVEALGAAGTAGAWIGLFLASTAVLSGLEQARALILSRTLGGEPVMLSRYVRTVWVTAMMAFTFGVQMVMSSPAPDIIYKDF